MESGILMSQHVQHTRRIFVYSLYTFYVSASYTISDDQLVAINCYAAIRNIVPEYRRQFASINPAEREYDVPGI